MCAAEAGGGRTLPVCVGNAAERERSGQTQKQIQRQHRRKTKTGARAGSCGGAQTCISRGRGWHASRGGSQRRSGKRLISIDVHLHLALGATRTGGGEERRSLPSASLPLLSRETN